MSRTVPKRAPRARRTRDAAARAPEILTRLRAAYPDARCALDHRGAFELLCATILSAQCTDARVNLVTPVLFARYPTPEALARAKQADVEAIIRSTGFFRNKARSLIGMAQALVADHGGEVPRTMEQLRPLPGRRPKDRERHSGQRLRDQRRDHGRHPRDPPQPAARAHPARRPVKIEQDLMPLFPRDHWALLSHLLIFHGRQVCVARRPRCGDCVLSDLCPSSAV